MTTSCSGTSTLLAAPPKQGPSGQEAKSVPSTAQDSSVWAQSYYGGSFRGPRSTERGPGTLRIVGPVLIPAASEKSPGGELGSGPGL